MSNGYFGRGGFSSLPVISFLIVLDKMFYICCCIKCLKTESYKFSNVVNLMVITIFCQNGCQELINEPFLNAEFTGWFIKFANKPIPFKKCFL